MDKLTPVQLFEFIIDYKKNHDGNSPTYREMCEGVGIPSTNTVFIYIEMMQKVGLIEKIDGKICLREGSWKYNPDAVKGESMYVKSNTATAES